MSSQVKRSTVHRSCIGIRVRTPLLTSALKPLLSAALNRDLNSALRPEFACHLNSALNSALTAEF
jgi:hypothetical protein